LKEAAGLGLGFQVVGLLLLVGAILLGRVRVSGRDALAVRPSSAT
jgi:hypothetical protein